MDGMTSPPLRDRGADAAQCLGVHLTDAAGPTGDHGDLAGEVEELLQVHSSIRHHLLNEVKCLKTK